MGPFTDRVVIVTGAARGLGRDYARLFALDGAAVVLADVADVGGAVDAVEATGARCLGVEVDVTSRVSTEAMVDRVVDVFGRIDVLVNNAGVWRGLAGPGAGLLDLTDERWQQAWSVNVTGTLNASRAVVSTMSERGEGRIINISSMASRSAAGAYGVTKMAVNQMTLALASELGERGITVNCVAPGISAFEGAKSNIDSADAVVAGNIIKRLGTSRELYAAMRYLCSDEAAWVTGQTLHVNGGAFAVF